MYFTVSPLTEDFVMGDIGFIVARRPVLFHDFGWEEVDQGLRQVGGIRSPNTTLKLNTVP